MGFFKELFSRKKNQTTEVAVYGDKLSFASHEAYRLLRTNLAFSFRGDQKSRVIGIVSSLKGDGKTTTAINLSFVLAENNAKVCLVEGDMRLPKLVKRLDLNSKVGLSEILTGQAEVKDAIQKHDFEKCSIDVISSGRIPPNPSELLAFPRTAELFEELKADYDYIILDLPPIDVVSDAIVVGQLLDGVVMTVGQGITQKKMLKLAMRQLALSNIRVLGFVRTFTSTDGFGYKKRNYRYRYGKGHYGSYYYDSYEAEASAARSMQDAEELAGGEQAPAQEETQES